MTKQELDAIREHYRYRSDGDALQVNRLLDHADRYAALTPDVIDRLIEMCNTVAVEEGGPYNRARAVLESLKEKP